MNLETLRVYCLSKAYTSEHLPFDHKTLVFKVGTKMFALVDIDEARTVNLKCDPERSLLLREEYSEIQPGYHMNKKHWNTVSAVSVTGGIRSGSESLMWSVRSSPVAGAARFENKRHRDVFWPLLRER